MDRAREPRIDLAHMRLLRGVVRIAPGELHLELERRERRAQFVRRIGDEGPLRHLAFLEAREQAVQCDDHRLDLVGRPHDDRREVRRRTGGKAPRELMQAAQAVADDEPDEQGQQQRAAENRQQRARRETPREQVAHGDRLRDLDIAMRLAQAVDRATRPRP